MPLLTFEITGDGAGGVVSQVQQTAPGHIESVTCFVKDGSTLSGQTRAQFVVAGPSGDILTKRATLVDDYVYDGGDAHFEGHIFTQEGETAIFSIRSFDTATIVCNVKTLRYDP